MTHHRTSAQLTRVDGQLTSAQRAAEPPRDADGVVERAAIAAKPPTGTKFDSAKPPLALLPTRALEAVGRVLAFGAAKYSEHNWRGGISYSRLAGAALRHVFAFLRGEDKDPETGESHLAHAACCVLFALEFIEEGRPVLDDRYKTADVSQVSK